MHYKMYFVQCRPYHVGLIVLDKSIKVNNTISYITKYLKRILEYRSEIDNHKMPEICDLAQYFFNTILLYLGHMKGVWITAI